MNGDEKSDVDDNSNNNPDHEDDEAHETGKSGRAKPFLKRKSRGVKFQKLNWNKVKSRTDCWGNKKSGRSENREPREKSIPAVAKYQAKIKKDKENELPKVKKAKNLRNVQSRIDTGIRKGENKYNYEEGSDSFEYNQYNLGDYANEDYARVQQQPQHHRHGADIRKFQFYNNQQQFDNQPKHDDNLEYEVFSEEMDNVPYENAEDYPEMHSHVVDPNQVNAMANNQNRYSNELEAELGK